MTILRQHIVAYTRRRRPDGLVSVFLRTLDGRWAGELVMTTAAAEAIKPNAALTLDIT